MQKPSEATMRRVADNMRAFLNDAVTWSAMLSKLRGRLIEPKAVYTDDDLEYWGSFFVENRLHARGILFEIFMLHPFEISQAALFGGRLRDPEDFLPLLPRQRDVARQVHPHVPAISKSIAGYGEMTAEDIYNNTPIFLRRQAD